MRRFKLNMLQTRYRQHLKLSIVVQVQLYTSEKKIDKFNE